MTTFKARFRANNQNDLKTFLVFGVKNSSTNTITRNSLFVSWICEDINTSFEDIMDEINMNEAEAFNIDLVSFFKA